jgi:hypothetical protein
LFLLILLSVRSTSDLKSALRQAGLFTVSYFVVLFVPLLVAWSFSDLLPASRYVAPHPAGLGFLEWVRSADHGTKTSAGLAQLLRLGLGWPQSFVSVGDLGQDLRLWLYKENPFPASAALFVLGLFYALVAYAAYRTVASASGLDGPRRAVVVASGLALCTNFVFGFLWKGTDLERYYPSLPFVFLSAAVLLNAWWVRAPSTAAMITAAVVVAAVASNVLSFQAVLGKDSFRQTWNQQLTVCCRGKDLVIVLGHRKKGVGLPHQSDFPEVMNLALTIPAKGTEWPRAVRSAMENVQRRGGRIILADSRLQTDAALRDGWSFRQNPDPTPESIAAFFLPWKSDRRVGDVRGESLWLATPPRATAAATP